MIWVSKPQNLDYTDCSVLCTPTILPAIRISWDENPTFMLISGRAPRSFIHPCASTGGLRPFDTVIIIYYASFSNIKCSTAFAVCHH